MAWQDWAARAVQGFAGAAGNTDAQNQVGKWQDERKQGRDDELKSKLAPLTQAANAAQTRLALFADPNDPTKPVAGKKDAYAAAHSELADIIGKIRMLLHPPPPEDPHGLGYLGARALDKLHITRDLANTARMHQSNKVNDYYSKNREQSEQQADVMAQGIPPPAPGALSPEEQHKANLVKGGIEPKAVVPKDAPENWQTLDVKFADGTTQTVQRNTKDGRFTDLAGKDIPPEKLSTASAVPKPSAVHAPTPKAGVSGGKNVFAVLTDNGWVDAGTKEPLKDFRPAPSFAETGLWGVDPVQNTDGSIGSAMVNRRTGQVRKITSVDGSPIAPSLMDQVNKSIEPALESDTRFRVMKDAEKDALNGNQQAQLNIVANHMGMTLGQQKGTRISQSQWNEAIGSAPWVETQVAKWFHTDENGDHVFDGYKGGVNITPTQIHQMVDLAVTRRNRQWQQAQQSGKMYGVNVPVPDDLDNPSSTLEGPGAKVLNGMKGKGGRIKVKLQDGRTGTIDAGDFDSKTMTKVQ